MPLDLLFFTIDDTQPEMAISFHGTVPACIQLLTMGENAHVRMIPVLERSEADKVQYADDVRVQ